ncbi:Hypothetical predicted protein [Paramuricea clavata]|uniref:Uncharacterized protein n=1 Tax=Paramuricea clavata TaxID=317549 RepID=A0A7D9IAC1_PARCT|nr:Hypothetical predicted protein [Paramuricea clavata]
MAKPESHYWTIYKPAPSAITIRVKTKLIYHAAKVKFTDEQQKPGHLFNLRQVLKDESFVAFSGLYRSARCVHDSKYCARFS